MVDVNQFYAEAPKEISQPEKTKDDLHQQRLARLAWELETRKKLDAEAQELEDAKNQVDTQVLNKEEKVKDLGKQLGKILKATRPVQEALNLKLDLERAQKGLSVLLPEPLYILFSQADAYARGLDSLLNVEIQGDFNKAKKFRMDVDDEDEEETVNKKNKIFRVHPLSVVLKIKTKDDDEIDVTFTYLVHLEIVTVQGRVILKHLSASADILEASSLLTQLYEEDDGSQSPNLKNEYQLKEAGISGDVGPMLRKTGFPFVWAQRLAGLNFLASSGPDKGISFLNMQKTVQKIRERFESRISLHEQIELLEQPKGFKPDSIPQEIIQLFPLKVSTKLKSWSSITWEKYCQFAETSSVCESGSVDSSDCLFKLVLNRGVASLTGLVCIKPDYPMSLPVFCLSLQWKDKWTAANNEWIRDLEREVNVESKKETEGVQSVLIYQVYKLMVLNDVLLEAVSSLDPEPLFTREK
ncbi:THO complex subunit 5 homolog, partial [Eurytemora carolleeae]|uniref:THO complex subunit 5 homolog n=1 Tax=Eurytemora carolleeae TaxID=1294199 RepID=UPI000C764951